MICQTKGRGREGSYGKIHDKTEDTQPISSTPTYTHPHSSGSGCATAVLARTLSKALGPSHRTLFFATDINARAIRATQATGVANQVRFSSLANLSFLLHFPHILIWKSSLNQASSLSSTPLPSPQVPYLEPLQVDLLLPLLPRLLHSIDVLLFNPPYVPTPSSEVGSRGIEASWAGGEDGREVLDRLLPSIPSLLSPQGGCMYLVAVNENRPEEICARMREAGLEAKVGRKEGRDGVGGWTSSLHLAWFDKGSKDERVCLLPSRETHAFHDSLFYILTL